LLTRCGRNFNELERTKTWDTPLKLNAEAARQGKRAICFVCSLSDFFHKDADHWRRKAWQTIRECPSVYFMLLTKRPERIMDCLPSDWGTGYPNAWLGTTCGVKASYHRVETLRSIPCALRFLSCEPLMESIADIKLDGIGWVAVGGMSGSKHAEYKMRMTWAAEVYDACQAMCVPFLFKQSSNIYTERGINALGLYLRERDGRTCDPVIRHYPVPISRLLPFTEHGKRFSQAEWEAYHG
jgi:protein gp37